MIGLRFFKSSFLAFVLCLETESKSWFLSFRKEETLDLKFVTFFLYSSDDRTFFCEIIFFSSS